MDTEKIWSTLPCESSANQWGQWNIASSFNKSFSMTMHCGVTLYMQGDARGIKRTLRYLTVGVLACNLNSRLIRIQSYFARQIERNRGAVLGAADRQRHRGERGGLQLDRNVRNTEDSNGR